MNRIDRLSAILIQLQSKKVITAQEIADRFDISLRTVYRDIRALEGAGVPIGAEAGKGYFIMEGYHLPPVMFTREEASAVLLGGKLIEKHSDESVKMHFNDALLKIKSVLKFSEKDYLEHLEDYIEVFHLPKPKQNLFPNNFLSDIQDALVRKKVLKFDYYSNYNDKFTSREVEPSGLCYYAAHWHLIAFCNLRDDFRDFRIDRITKLQISEKDFDPARHKNFKSFVKDIVIGKELQEVKIRVTKDLARYLSEQKYYWGFLEQKELENDVEMTFMTSDLLNFSRWLLMYGKGATIISPDNLKEHLANLIAELQEHHIGEGAVEAKNIL
ncbi:YafY family protein [Fulvivirgaceae bacterium BMA10]|uniref:YafY family protein n=1 Tax=Splendidivirga corallicola TaxID=3051826 RepID=A0ABT8KNU9_9BACT|nr:YafY family protein [Fulvivirgaceae bacterium BMA10]